MQHHPFSKPLIIGSILCGVLTLGACANVGRGVQRIGTNIHEQTIEYDRRLSKMFESEGEQARLERLPKPDTGYCYRTLGEVSCYEHALVGQNSRLVGKQIPKPMFDEFNYPLPEERPEAVFIDIASAPETGAQPTANVAPPTEVYVAPAPPMLAPQTDGAMEADAPTPLMPVIE